MSAPAPPSPRRRGSGELDVVLLRRFGWVRAVGGAAYIVAVGVLALLFGREVWPLLLGVPILAVVTTVYFMRTDRHAGAAVAVSLVADALVLGGAVAYFGGTGSGLVMLYAIVVVSAGILLGPSAGLSFLGFTVALSVLQLGLEQAGITPALLHRPDLGERLPIFLVSVAGLASVGYLTANYASRLHELIAEAGLRAEDVRRRGRRRRSFVWQSVIDLRTPLRELEAIAQALDDRWDELDGAERRLLAARLRIGTARLDAEVSQLAAAGGMDESGEHRPEPVLLARVVQDCLAQLGEALEPYVVDVDVQAIKVAADPRSARRVVLSLLENVIEHCPRGTHVQISSRSTGSLGVLIVSDDGPGIPSGLSRRLFDAPDEGGGPRVGLPLVRALCDAMGAEIRYARPAAGGTRFLVSFPLVPRGAPTADDVADAQAEAEGAHRAGTTAG